MTARRRVVFCWEMGGNYGHIAGFLPIYRELKKQNVEVFCVLRSLQFAYLLGEGAIAQCFQAPSPKFVPAAPRELYSYADILACIGYLEEPVLTRYLTEWCSLLTHLNADLLIADHAPTALLAARVLGLASAVISTGFISPPATETFPLFSPELQSPPQKIDEQLLKVVNRSLYSFRAAPLLFLADIFSSSQLFLCTLAELDHYGVREAANYRGPLYSDDIGNIFTWPSGVEQNIFVYLTPKVKNLRTVLGEIAQLPGYKLLHLPGVDAEMLTDFSQRSDITIHSAPVQMRSVLQNVSLVIGQGGVGLTAQCFMNGIPQVIIPTQTEQRMLARRLTVQGIGLAVDPLRKDPPYAQVFARALESPELQNICQLAKNKYAGFSQQKQVTTLTQELLM